MATNNSTNNYGFTSAGLLNAGALNPSHILNLGISYSAGTLSVTSANGTALSASNAGYITLPTGTAGQMNSLSLTANQTFVDAAGSSTINNNSFGTSAATWAVDMPFYLYAASDSTDANPIFLIARIPHIKTTPVAGNIGKTGSAVASTQGSMFALGNPTVANYASRPCVCIGSFRMRKSSTTDWTVQTLATSDGIGSFQENAIWTFPTGQIGNASGKYYLDNGGTAPAWSANFVTYKMSKDGMVWANWLLFNSPGVGTAGAGAVTLTAAIPLELNAGAGQVGHNAFGGFQNTATNPFFLCGPIIATSQVTFRLLNGTLNLLTNASFNGTIGYGHNWSLNYPARVTA